MIKIRKKDSLEKRLDRIRNLYFELDDFFDKIPIEIPDQYKNQIKKSILEDEDLKRIMRGLEERRPPRFLMVGRTGVGKSSLINAICGEYVADVSDVKVGTKGVERYTCMDGSGEKILMEILDSRGIGESQEVSGTNTAENQLIEEAIRFRPDALIFVTRCKSRDRINEDIDFVDNLHFSYYKTTKIDLPVFVVLNQADEMEPSEYKIPEEYVHRKLDNIKDSVQQVNDLLKGSRFSVSAITAVSSKIDWGYSPDEVSEMLPQKRKKLKIVKDYRYNINELIDQISKSLNDDGASIGFMMASDMSAAIEIIANKFVNIFSSIASLIAATPIPIADIFILTALQLIMVMMIGYISGEDLSLKAAEKFMVDVLGIGIGAQLFKLTAKQLLKLIPGFGAVVNGSVAYTGTKAIGKMAIEHYVHGISIGKIRKKKKEK